MPKKQKNNKAFEKQYNKFLSFLIKRYIKELPALSKDQQETRMEGMRVYAHLFTISGTEMFADDLAVHVGDNLLLLPSGQWVVEDGYEYDGEELDNYD